MARTSQNSTHLAIEKRVPVVELQGGLYSNLPAVINNSLTANSLVLNQAVTAKSGSTAATLANLGGATGPQTAAQNSWLAVAINGATYYVPLWQ